MLNLVSLIQKLYKPFCRLGYWSGNVFKTGMGVLTMKPVMYLTLFIVVLSPSIENDVILHKSAAYVFFEIISNLSEIK